MMGQPSSQPSLFGNDRNAIAARFAPVFEAWQPIARQLLRARTVPDAIHWAAEPERLDDYGSGTATVDIEPVQNANTPRIPKDFVPLARAASCHRNPDRWALLYRLAYRLAHDDRYLLDRSGDPDVVRLTRYAQAVRRDAHKMKAFVRFREINDADSSEAAVFVAWFEPDHPIVEYTADFFRRRFANMAWSIYTPWRSAHWQPGGRLRFAAGSDGADLPTHDSAEAAWRTYYRSIFNPARVKISAMQAEMPQKYWKNLPEAAEISDLIRHADARVADMQDHTPSSKPLRCGPRPTTPEHAEQTAARQAPYRSIDRLRHEAATCRACDLCQHATQTVFGEGPASARGMLVGEQPGDTEDLAGRPFVGPAGQLLDRALDEIGLARSTTYLTNVVKHFKFTPRGKRRIHAKPAYREIEACRGWLEREIETVNPERIICLGTTAASTVLDRPVRIGRDRGKLIRLGNDSHALVTVHPSHLLRAGNDGAAEDAFRQFKCDLSIAL